MTISDTCYVSEIKVRLIPFFEANEINTTIIETTNKTVLQVIILKYFLISFRSSIVICEREGENTDFLYRNEIRFILIICIKQIIALIINKMDMSVVSIRLNFVESIEPRSSLVCPLKF
jgi:hypothetical protein